MAVYTVASELDAVRTKLTDAGYAVTTAELIRAPKSTITITDAKTAETLMKLMDALDDIDDVTDTAANFELSPEVTEAV